MAGQKATTEYRRGLALVMVLWIFVMLTVVMVVVARTSRLDSRITAVTGDQFRCKWACRAATEAAIAILNDDEKESDSLNDLWYDNPDDLKNVELDGCVYTIEVIDEASKLNINTVNAKQLMYLPDMTEEIANCILDWRDKDDDIRTGSAEAGYYINLPHPYQIRNQALRTTREMLRIKGVTEELFYGPEKDTDKFGEIDDDNETVVRAESGISEGNLTNYNEGWFNYLTRYSVERNLDGEGNRKIDINKANERRLARDLDIPDAYAKWIVENRKNGFKGIGELFSNNSPDSMPDGIDRSDKASPLDVKTILSIAGKITVSPRAAHGKVNINTASKVVLAAILEGREDIAEDIINYRESSAYGITDLSELADLTSIKKDILKKSIDAMTLRSDIYMIRSFASANLTDTRLSTEAVVDRGITPTRIIYFSQGAKY